MRKLRQVKTDFTAGELDPLLIAREDIKAYQKGVSRLRNWAQLDSGAVTRRPGSKYLAALFSGAILKPFSFGQEQDYVFSFSNTRADIYTDDGVFATSITGAPWLTSQLSRLYTAQALDTMIVTHPDMATQRILRTSATTFSRTAFTFEQNEAGTKMFQPYYKFADDTVTIDPSATTGAITVVASASIFVAGHVGTIIRHKKKEILVTAFTSGTQVSGTVRETLTDANATTDWDEPVFSPVRGYANTAIFHEGRLWFCGTKSLPSHIFASKVDAYFNFDVGTGLDDESIQVAIRSERIGDIRGVSSLRHLQVYTDEAEFYAPSSESRPLTPGTFSMKVQTRFGCGFVVPQPFDGATLFVQKGGKSLREFLYQDTEAAYTSGNISILAPHLINNPVSMAVLFGSTTRPEQYSYIVNSDGSMIQFHSIRAEAVAGFCLWTTDGLYKSVCVVGGKVFVAVERTLNGSTVRVLEVFEDDRTLDCSIDITAGGPTTSFTGLTHLLNEDVHVVSGGLYYGEFTVTGAGGLTTDDEATTITAGLDYTPSFTTMPAIGVDQQGSLMGEIKRLVRCVIVLNTTLDCVVNNRTLLIRKVNDDLSLDPTPFTGKKEFALRGYSRDAQMTVQQEVPLPLTVLGFNLEIQF